MGGCAGGRSDRWASWPVSVPGIVLRPGVLASLSDPSLRVGVITAPAGYGKTSHAAAFAEGDGRPVAWIDASPGHDEPGLLLRDLVDALGTVAGLDVSTVPTTSIGIDLQVTGVGAALGRAVRRCPEPFVLVIDDVHHLANPAALDVLEAVASNVPPGSAVVLVGRTCALGALARLRVEDWVAEIGAEDLSLDVHGVADLLANVGFEASETHAAQVLAATEGWPVGVRLAAKGARADGDTDLTTDWAPSGREPMVSAYLHAEWILGVDERDRAFLRQVSVLDWLSGPLCDAVLGREDSGEVLARIHGDRHLLIPLDRRGDAYRMHGLLSEALQAELERVDPCGARCAHHRASEWFDAHGDPDRAIRHAVAAEDSDRAERLVIAHTPVQYANGHFATIHRWVELLPIDRVRRSPGLCVSETLAALGLGNTGAVSVWLRFGETAVAEAPGADPMAELCLLDLKATSNTGPARAGRDDAERAYRGLPPGIWHAGACLAFGVWAWTIGEDGADAVIEEGIDEASVLGAPALEAYCCAVRSMMAHVEGDAVASRSLALRAWQVASDHGLSRVPGMAIVNAQHALVSAAGGDAEGARSDWQLARSQLAMFRDLSGWANVHTRLALAHTSLLLGDRPGAETLLREAREFLLRQPDAVLAREQLAKLEELVQLLRSREGSGASSLTTAELRVLHYLPTNLSLAEIAERLYVSRYTIKTHCESIYRKLGVRSRSEAVSASRSLGLLDAFGLPDDS